MRLGVANNMRPLSWGGGAQTEKIQKFFQVTDIVYDMNDEDSLYKIKKYSRILRIKESSYKDVSN